MAFVALIASAWQMQPLTGAADAAAPQARTWEIVSSQNPDPEINNLVAVSMRSATDGWAVGNQGSFGVSTLIERWDGSAWNLVESPNGLGDGYLAGVVSISDQDAWAVGWDQRF